MNSIVLVERNLRFRCCIGCSCGEGKDVENQAQNEQMSCFGPFQHASLTFKRIAQFTLTRETDRVSWVGIPLELTVVGMAVAITIHKPVSPIKWVKFEVIFPTISDSIIIVFNVVKLWAVFASVSICVIANRIRTVLQFLIVGVVLEVVVEFHSVRCIRVNVAFSIG